MLSYYRMYVIIGKEDCQQCYVLKNLMFAKSIDHIYMENTEFNQDFIDYLKKTNKTYPMVLEVKNFNSFQHMMSCFRDLKN